MSDQVDDRGEVDPDSFRVLMSTFPSGVTVVTAADGQGAPLGLTCSSLCSVSVEPPLLLICVRSGSRTLSVICRVGVFAVNFLHSAGREAADLFSSDVPDRFSRVPWRQTRPRALPSLPVHAHTVAECEVTCRVPAGDHTVVIGEVVSIARLAAARPLLHGLRQYAEWPQTPSGSPDTAGRRSRVAGRMAPP
jgi:flavin reductase (DIM6/NTAB) family NADH-FMN oxidoreductase RutF